MEAAEPLDLEKEKKLILKEYKNLLRGLRNNMTGAERKQIRLAFEMAVDAHKNMRRKSGEPYIHHPIAVAKIVAGEMGLGTTSVICALLHDTVEDTTLTLEDIQREFGSSSAKIIDGLTKISKISHQTESIQAENYRKILLTLSDDIRVILIKIADRLHNMRTLDGQNRKNQLKIASETIYLYAPLSHRLGLYSIKGELEDLAMKYTETEKYKEIAKALEKVSEIRRVSIEDARALGFWHDDLTDENPVPDVDGLVEVPMWRHALINIAHPLLKQGLVILDTPGLNAIGAEPELTVSLIPQAHAVVFILGADTGVTKSDLSIWREHLIAESGETDARHS